MDEENTQMGPQNILVAKPHSKRSPENLLHRLDLGKVDFE
jgi:hypothetical protein